MKKKIATLLAILLLVSLVGCGSSTGNIEPATSDAAQPTQTIEPTQEPTAEPSEEPTAEPAQEPTTAQTEEPKEHITPSKEPTPEPSQEPTEKPTEVAKPAHSHSYTSSVTKEATCSTKGVRTYKCSCGDSYTEEIATTNHNYNSTVSKEPTCAEEGIRTFTCVNCGVMYIEAIPKNSNHSWTTRHVDAEGYYDNGGTHKVTFYRCKCGFEVNTDQPDVTNIWRKHSMENLDHPFEYWTEDVPNGEPTWVEVSPAYDETYCIYCGAIQ